MDMDKFNIITPLEYPMTITKGIHTIPITIPIYYCEDLDQYNWYARVHVSIISVMLEVKILSIQSNSNDKVSILIAGPGDSTILLTWDEHTQHFLHSFVKSYGLDDRSVHSSQTLSEANEYVECCNLWLKRVLYNQLSGLNNMSANLNTDLIDEKLMSKITSILDHLARQSDHYYLIYRFNYQNGRVTYHGCPRYTLPTWNELN